MMDSMTADCLSVVHHHTSLILGFQVDDVVLDHLVNRLGRELRGSRRFEDVAEIEHPGRCCGSCAALGRLLSVLAVVVVVLAQVRLGHVGGSVVEQLVELVAFIVGKNVGE